MPGPVEVEGASFTAYAPMSDGLERHFRVAKIPYCDENQFASNRIATNKYNAATFLPLNLFEQCVYALLFPLPRPRGRRAGARPAAQG